MSRPRSFTKSSSDLDCCRWLGVLALASTRRLVDERTVQHRMTDLHSDNGTAVCTGSGQQHGSLLSRVLGWLTAGYPSGVPPTERYALIAVLKRTLTDAEIHQVIGQLTAADSPALADGVISDQEIRDMITRVLEQPPRDGDITKVSVRLAAAGWPLQGQFGEPAAV